MFTFMLGLGLGIAGTWFWHEFHEPLKVWREKRKKEIEEALKK
jgi:hypothetical protein